MHFYDFNIGDYVKKTQHLTNEEDLAYRRALDMYYDTEQPLPITSGLATLSRRLRVSENSLKNVIEEFFPEGRNRHADEKIAEYHAYLTRQKINGGKGGRPKHKPSGNPVVSQNNPVPSQPLTTKPLTTNQELKENTLVTDKSVDQIPYGEIFSLYNQILQCLPAIKQITESRKKSLKARWHEDSKRQSIEWWGKYFRFVGGISFLIGENDRGWQADIDFLLNQKKMVKIIEGGYDGIKNGK
ncbi:Protein of unknown function DUF1376 [uncultured Caudovirales phage]|uniref:Uncharacterized protein n=1 Tax=uncultured Caudovirales phage TaxID=2100421 RepID=A0A6J5LDG5_9CAUD|nr:Protein of unknown function DUF1376 [uncultured Caudovirales phage]